MFLGHPFAVAYVDSLHAAHTVCESNWEKTVAKKTTKPRRGPVPALLKGSFHVDQFDSLIKHLSRNPLKGDKTTITDNIVAGLRAIVRDTGGISFHVNYTVGASRPYLKIGTFPEMSVAEARGLARTIQALAAMGIDPQDGLHERLIRELKAKGTAWRP